MEGLIAHYQNKNFAEEEEKHKLMREGKLRVQLREKELREKGPEKASAESTALGGGSVGA